MTSAQRRKKLASFKLSRRKKGFPWMRLVFPGVILGAILTYISLTSRLFGKNSKITVVINQKDSVTISTFDKEAGTISDLIIPPGTQVNVSRQLGTWRVESVWKLGENEKLGGVLLSETIIKNFKIPVDAWADAPFPSLRALLGYKTNLGMGDKLRLGLFSLSVSPSKKTETNLASQNFLRKTKLVGGEEGYLISENFPQSLYSAFSDAKINKLNPRILIEDSTGGGAAVNTLAQTLEALGGKATSIVKKESKLFSCEVIGENKETVQRIAGIFECDFSRTKLENNFDVTIRIGEDFARRFN